MLVNSMRAIVDDTTFQDTVLDLLCLCSSESSKLAPSIATKLVALPVRGATWEATYTATVDSSRALVKRAYEAVDEAAASAASAASRAIVSRVSNIMSSSASDINWDASIQSIYYPVSRGTAAAGHAATSEQLEDMADKMVFESLPAADSATVETVRHLTRVNAQVITADVWSHLCLAVNVATAAAVDDATSTTLSAAAEQGLLTRAYEH